MRHNDSFELKKNLQKINRTIAKRWEWVLSESSFKKRSFFRQTIQNRLEKAEYTQNPQKSEKNI